MISSNPPAADPGRCALNAPWNAYQCTPAARYAMLAFESLDSDALTRRVFPVTLTAHADAYYPAPFNNHLAAQQDVRWDQGYTSLKRLSRFPAIVQVPGPAALRPFGNTISPAVGTPTVGPAPVSPTLGHFPSSTPPPPPPPTLAPGHPQRGATPFRSK